MAGSVTFTDNTMTVSSTIADIALRVLEECGGEMEAAVKRNTRVDTGQTKNSWEHKTAAGADDFRCVIGSNYINAIWEEFGTGEFALNGDGRKGGWVYYDAQGKRHFTHGKTPSRAFQRAYDAQKNKLISHMQEEFRKGMS